MTFEEVSRALVEGCRTGQEVANLDRLYAAGAVSVEPYDMGQGREAHGLDAIKAKHAWWDSEMETIDSTIGGPYPDGGDRFAVHFRVTGRNKADGTTWEMEEVGLYTVLDGKIVREEFFYSRDPA